MNIVSHRNCNICLVSFALMVGFYSIIASSTLLYKTQLHKIVSITSR